jgi:hypothetical protein
MLPISDLTTSDFTTFHFFKQHHKKWTLKKKMKQTLHWQKTKLMILKNARIGGSAIFFKKELAAIFKQTKNGTSNRGLLPLGLEETPCSKVFN